MSTTQKKVTDSISPTSVVSENIPNRRMSPRLHARKLKLIKTSPVENPSDDNKQGNKREKKRTQRISNQSFSDHIKHGIGKDPVSVKSDLKYTLKSSKRIRSNTMLDKKPSVTSASSTSCSPSSFTLTTTSDTFSESDCVTSVSIRQRLFQNNYTGDNCSIHFPPPLTEYNKYNANIDMLWCYQVGPANRDYKSYNYEQYKINPRVQSFWWKPEDFFIHQSILGSGKFGVVQCCIEKRSGDSFAVKSLNKDALFNNGNSLELLRREVEIHSRLEHANILKLLGYYHDSSTVYLVQELSTEGNLHQYQLYNGGSLPHHLASRYVDQVLRALSFMHDNGVFHRDLKPENLLLFGPNQRLLKLCDFGWSIACRSSEYTRSTLCGTPEYVPIEMISNKSGETTRYDVRYVDNWQCGILAFELARGYTPFHMSRAKLNALQEENGYADPNEIIFGLIRKMAPVAHYDRHRSDEDLVFHDFITSLTKKTPTDRISAKEALHHKWITSYQNR